MWINAQGYAFNLSLAKIVRFDADKKTLEIHWESGDDPLLAHPHRTRVLRGDVAVEMWTAIKNNSIGVEANTQRIAIQDSPTPPPKLVGD